MDPKCNLWTTNKAYGLNTKPMDRKYSLHGLRSNPMDKNTTTGQKKKLWMKTTTYGPRVQIQDKKDSVNTNNGMQ